MERVMEQKGQRLPFDSGLGVGTHGISTGALQGSWGSWGDADSEGRRSEGQAQGTGWKTARGTGWGAGWGAGWGTKTLGWVVASCILLGGARVMALPVVPEGIMPLPTLPMAETRIAVSTQDSVPVMGLGSLVRPLLGTGRGLLPGESRETGRTQETQETRETQGSRETRERSVGQSAESSPDRAVVPIRAAAAEARSPGPALADAAGTGTFRVGNQTDHPLRVALLSRHPSAGAKKLAADGTALGLADPVHWDFAPGEGKVNGLILSLREGDIEIGPGDVLVVFAQDGSQRYWGPFVVGETPLPYWHQERQEWQLLVQP